uniref:Pseudouridylate synthase 1 homolog n=1 Tax=Trichuris muris TaxID=70415 RepID=A0A5S6R091_TRIMR
MHSSTYCWNRSGARQPFNHVLPRSSRYPITLKRRYVWRTQQPVSQLHTSKISTAQKIVSKYRLRRNLSYNRVAKPYAARVPSCFVGGPAGRHRASRSKLGGLITSRYVFRQITSDASPSSNRSCMRPLLNYVRLLLCRGKQILSQMEEDVTKHKNIFDELPFKRARHEDDEEEKKVVEESANNTFVRRKKLKYALLLSYRGKAYHGMQINQETPTIEYFLFDALKKLDFISEEQARKPSSFKFQRAARTDKGVSAARQVCSVQLPLKEDATDEAISSLNNLLPEDIRIMAIQRTTRGFDSKKWCDSRLYSYVLPAFCFAPMQEAYDAENYRLSDESLKEINRVLQYYVGTHNFFNFTSGKSFTEESSKRYIMESKCSRLPFNKATEYLIVSFRGQSFLIHQIRKMIGLCVSIVRGHCTEDYMRSVWLPERVRIPMAPALGLLLEEPFFTYYNERFEATHKPLCWDSVRAKCDQFREQHIIADIIETDEKEKMFDEWLRYLGEKFWKKEGGDAEEVESPLTADEAAKVPTGNF